MNKNEIISFIKNEFKNGKIRDNMFPMMTKFGVRDYSETVHSLGLNYITAIGRQIEGISAISECPVYPNKNYSNHNFVAAEESEGYNEKISEVRPDSIWFLKESNEPILICEFERYEKGKRKDLKIKEKIENLLIAYHQLGGNVPLILFVYWSYSTENPKYINECISILDNGFRKNNGAYIPGINGVKTSYLIYRSVANGTSENLKLNQWVEVG